MLKQNSKNIQDNLLALFRENADATSARFAELSKSDAGIKILAQCFEALSFSRVRANIKFLYPEEFKALEKMTRGMAAPLSADEQARFLTQVYKDFLLFGMAYDAAEDFTRATANFIRKMSAETLETLLASRNPGEVSLLSVILAPYEMARILEILPKKMSEQIAAVQSRHARLPKDVLHEQAFAFVNSLREQIHLERAKAEKAKEQIQNAIAQIDLNRERAMAQLIQSEMPELKKILEEKGYFEGLEILKKGVSKNGNVD